MSFNIATKIVSPTTILTLTDPETGGKLVDDKGEVANIELYGKASKQYRDALANLARKTQIRKNKAQSFETNVEDNVEILVAISKTSNLTLADGTPVTTPAAFKSLYSEPGLFWIKDQVQDTLEDTAAFLQR
jgi:hypothetical protein